MTVRNELGPFIRNYELLSYPTRRASNDSVRRVKRGAEHWSNAERVRFKALGREFRLVLHPDLSSFSEDFVMTTSGGAVDVDLSHIFSGHIEGDPGSRVFGSVVDGVFHGRISAASGHTFYAEPAWMYSALQEKGHTVFYSEEDVRLPAQLRPHGGCGFDQLQTYMHRQNVATGASAPFQHLDETPMKLEMDNRWRRPYQNGGKRRVRRSPDYADPPPGSRRKPRSGKGRRRSSRQESTRRVCHMQVVIDHLLYQFFMKGADDKTARERITSMIGTHMASTNLIYSTTDFKGIVGMRFVIQDLRINDTSACEGADAASNPFCRNDLDANLMLQLFALEERNDFCLSYAWTNRDLGEGTLGLAYLAYASDKLGGACEKFRSVNTREGIRRMALNTGVITLYLHGGPVALAVSEVTVAHEIGHSFGALHDETPECAPGGANGNYIMFARATTGRQPFNRKFSPCSIRGISAVLSAILNGLYDKENCFLSHQESFCGNNVREENEDCDCGYNEKDCHDLCCYARKNSQHVPGCTLRPNAQCSPSAGSCCSTDCHFVSANQQCSAENECNYASFCRYPSLNEFSFPGHICSQQVLSRRSVSLDGSASNETLTAVNIRNDAVRAVYGQVITGVAALCPEPRHKANLSECNRGTQVCLSGRCEGSICQKYGYDDCQRSSSAGSSLSPADMCLVDCMRAGTDGHCVGTCNEPTLSSLCGRKRERGAACNQNRGYCDVFHRCRTVDEDGPLARLEQLLVPNRLREWFKRYTWLVAILGVLFLSGVLLFIRCCAVLTPTNNPGLPKARTLRESVQRPMEIFTNLYQCKTQRPVTKGLISADIRIAKSLGQVQRVFQVHFR
nr:disintegrin and metalloproteinase domain-containing protein 10-like [Rhipicephalus microplus]